MIRKILIVDDEPDIVETVSYLLSARGYEVNTATDAREAMRSIQSDRPDFIFLDVRLPGISGYELCRILKQNELYERLPVVLLTAIAPLEEEAAAVLRRVGADGQILKPFEIDEIFAQIERWSAGEGKDKEGA